MSSHSDHSVAATPDDAAAQTTSKTQKAQALLRGLTFKDSEVTNTLESIHRALSDDSEGSWAALPQRLRGRGDWLIERGRFKDAELMFDAATEIDGLRARREAAPTTCCRTVPCQQPGVGPCTMPHQSTGAV